MKRWPFSPLCGMQQKGWLSSDWKKGPHQTPASSLWPCFLGLPELWKINMCGWHSFGYSDLFQKPRWDTVVIKEEWKNRQKVQRNKLESQEYTTRIANESLMRAVQGSNSGLLNKRFCNNWPPIHAKMDLGIDLVPFMKTSLAWSTDQNVKFKPQRVTSEKRGDQTLLLTLPTASCQLRTPQAHQVSAYMLETK